MTSDISTLAKSTLNACIFADVGTELNGSTLTVLSALSRLGEDPWSVATALMQLPRAAADR